MVRPRQRVCLQDGPRLDINYLRRAGAMPTALNGESSGTQTASSKRLRSFPASVISEVGNIFSFAR
jgi:hypothetical protein